MSRKTCMITLCKIMQRENNVQFEARKPSSVTVFFVTSIESKRAASATVSSSKLSASIP